MVPTRYRTQLAGHDSSGAFILRYICSLVLPFETKLTRLTTTDEQYDALKPIEDPYEEFPFTWSSNQSTGSERSFASLASDESFHYRECEPPM